MPYDFGTDELHSDMRCTANGEVFCTIPPTGNFRRCERPIGHAGLHRVVVDDIVYEFPNSRCTFLFCKVGD